MPSQLPFACTEPCHALTRAPPPQPACLSCLPLLCSCSGVCDATIAACYCDGPKYGHVPPPLGSPPGTPPIKQGRMLGDHCNPKTVGWWLEMNQLDWV